MRFTTTSKGPSWLDWGEEIDLSKLHNDIYNIWFLISFFQSWCALRLNHMPHHPISILAWLNDTLFWLSQMTNQAPHKEGLLFLQVFFNQVYLKGLLEPGSSFLNRAISTALLLSFHIRQAVAIISNWCSFPSGSDDNNEGERNRADWMRIEWPKSMSSLCRSCLCRW